MRRVLSRTSGWGCVVAADAIAAAQRRWATVTPIEMPSLSPTMTTGTIKSWNKKVGDRVNPSDVICSVETDKAAVDFEYSDEGWLARILKPEGSTDVALGEVIGLMVEEEADIASDDVKNYVAPSVAKKAAAPPAAEEKQAPAAAAAADSSSGRSGDRVFASPLARSMAKERGVDLSQVKGTGGSVGRVTKADIENFTPGAAAAPRGEAAAAGAQVAAPSQSAPSQKKAPPPPPTGDAPATFEDIPVSNMRRVIATRLVESKNVDVPHYYVTRKCNMEAAMKVIKHLNQAADGKYKITVNDYLIKALAKANVLTPEANTHWYGDVMRRYNNVDVSVAVATPNGLITPIIKNAESKGLAEISMEMKELSKKARDGKLQPHEYQGGTATISNMGGLGVDNFTAIINPPHSMILAVGSAKPEIDIVSRTNPETGEEELVPGKVVRKATFTASFDHRVVDGAVGAEWFKHFRRVVEDPLGLLL